MKIDQNTINVLKNFSTINPSIAINKGNVIKTMSPSKTIVAKSVVSSDFPRNFAIYNLGRFISIISTFNDPEFTFFDKHVDISEGNSVIHYVYADESVIIQAPEKDLVMPTVNITFTLTNDDLRNVEKAASILSLPMLIVSGNDGKLFVQTADLDKPTGDVYAIQIGETDLKFKAVFKRENIKMVPGDYSVDICPRMAKFYTQNLEYFVAIEAKYSEF